MSAGVAFVVLFVAGARVIFGNNPNLNKHDSDAVVAAKYVAKLSSSSSRVGILVGAYLVALAALAFAWFSQGLPAPLAPRPPQANPSSIGTGSANPAQT